MNKNKPTFDAFISYSAEDGLFAKNLANALRNQGLKVWYDEGKLRFGDSFLREIENALEESRYFILILSPSYFDKQWANFELGVALSRDFASRKKHIFPIYARDIDPKSLPPSLAKLGGLYAKEHPVDEIAAILAENILQDVSESEA